MSEMLLVNPENKRTVTDYELLFLGGMSVPVTIDEKQGDTLTIGDTTVTVYLAPKPSIHGNDTKTPAENLTLFKAHLIAIKYTDREVMDLTPEQRFQWNKSIAKLSRNN